MRPVNVSFLIALCVVSFLPGCAAKTSKQSAITDGFVGVSKVHLIEETDPMFLNETEAKTFHELLGKGLALKGYDICETDCTGDIKIRTNISKYQYQGATKRSLLAGGVAAINFSWIKLDITVEKNGEVIYKNCIDRREQMDLKTATFNHVTWFLRAIPKRI